MRLIGLILAFLTIGSSAWAQCSGTNLSACPSPPFNAVTAATYAGDASASTVAAPGTTVANSLASRFSLIVYAKDFGVKCDGSTDDAANINAAIVAAEPSTSGQGVVQLPAGICIVGTPVTLQTGVVLSGNNRDATTIRGKAGTTTSVIQTVNFATLTGTNTAAGPYQWGLESLTIDGNKSARTGSVAAAAFYGYDFNIIDVNFKNSTGVGAYSEWAISGNVPVAAGGNSMESHWDRVKFFSNATDGLVFNGPHDSVFNDALAFINGRFGANFGQSAAATAGGTFLTNFHSYGNSNIGLVIGTGINVNGVESESNTTGGLETTSTGYIIGTGVTTFGNTGYGASFNGSGSIISSETSFSNTLDGVDLFASGNSISNLSSMSNAGTGLSVTANGNSVAGYSLSGNTTANQFVSTGNTSIFSLGVVAGVFSLGLPGFTVSTLPACGAAIKGQPAYVTDATSPTYNGTLTGGGSVVVLALCNGTAWSAH